MVRCSQILQLDFVGTWHSTAFSSAMIQLIQFVKRMGCSVIVFGVTNTQCMRIQCSAVVCLDFQHGVVHEHGAVLFRGGGFHCPDICTTFVVRYGRKQTQRKVQTNKDTNQPNKQTKTDWKGCMYKQQTMYWRHKDIYPFLSLFQKNGENFTYQCYPKISTTLTRDL